MTTNRGVESDCVALPDSVIARLFAAMRANYGKSFEGKWASGTKIVGGAYDGLDEGIVSTMRYWAERLGGYRDKLGVIKVALTRLPPHPPSLPEFLEICRVAGSVPQKPAGLGLPSPKLSAEQAARNRERMAAMCEKLVKGVAL